MRRHRLEAAPGSKEPTSTPTKKSGKKAQTIFTKMANAHFRQANLLAGILRKFYNARAAIN